MTDNSPEYGGTKYNAGKPMISLVEPLFIEGIAKVLTFGAKKYDVDNWKKGIPENEVIDALLRHLIDYRKGEHFDPETGLDHRDHIGCNLMFWKHLYPAKHFDIRFITSGTNE